MVTLGFLGAGWIGRNRMEAMLATGEAKAGCPVSRLFNTKITLDARLES